MADAPAAFDAGVEQHALDGVGEPARFGLDARPVLLHARGIGDEAVGEVLRRGADHRDRRAQLVRDGGDELHLLARESLGALGGDGQHRDAREHQQQHAEAEDRGCGSERPDRRLERARRGAARPASTATFSNGFGLPLASITGRRVMLMNRLRR